MDSYYTYCFMAFLSGTKLFMMSQAVLDAGNIMMKATEQISTCLETCLFLSFSNVPQK